SGCSERSHFFDLIEFLHPYSILRVLAENPANLRIDVVWNFGILVSAGWAQNGDFVPDARRSSPLKGWSTLES
ncbi:HEPN/Toprim-associated domain-containing protein, partial [Mesorhizobium japonicum]|uniref:HEPN/Toprim-associated domain-containing protein n=1 Tax=Mesorhizobium japonicum TaxID=2066070 RepID=UPI003B5BFE91